MAAAMGPERRGHVLDILKSYNLKGLEIDCRLCGVWNVSGEGEIEARGRNRNRGHSGGAGTSRFGLGHLRKVVAKQPSVKSCGKPDRRSRVQQRVWLGI